MLFQDKVAEEMKKLWTTGVDVINMAEPSSCPAQHCATCGGMVMGKKMTVRVRLIRQVHDTQAMWPVVLNTPPNSEKNSCARCHIVAHKKTITGYAKPKLLSGPCVIHLILYMRYTSYFEHALYILFKYTCVIHLILYIESITIV